MKAAKEIVNMDMIANVFSKFKECSSDDHARAIMNDFLDMGALFEETDVDDWYEKTNHSNQSGDTVENISSTLSSTCGKTILSSDHISVGQEYTQTAEHFDFAVCDGTADSTKWLEANGVFDERSLLKKLIEKLGGHEEYKWRSEAFNMFVQLSVLYKNSMSSADGLDIELIKDLVQAQIRLVAVPAGAAVEKWDPDCMLKRTFQTSAGTITVRGYPDFGYFSGGSSEGDSSIASGRIIMDILRERAVELGELRALKRPLSQDERAREIVAAVSTHPNSLGINYKALQFSYCSFVTFAIKVTSPTQKHHSAQSGEEPTAKALPRRSAGETQLCCQLLAQQDKFDRKPPVSGLLTDGVSGTVILLCGRKRNKAGPHVFVRLPAADSVLTLFHYMMLISFFSADELQKLFMKHTKTVVTAGCKRKRHPCDGDGGNDGGNSEGSRSDDDEDVSDLSSRDRSASEASSSEDEVDPSVFCDEDGFDSEAEFNYYTNPRRAWRMMYKRLFA